VAAFSLIVTQFQSPSTFAAVVTTELPGGGCRTVANNRGTHHRDCRTRGASSLRRFDLTVIDERQPSAQGLVDIDPFDPRSGHGIESGWGSGVVRATAGISAAGTGRIIRPGADNIRFLAQRPYLPPGTLRQVLEPTAHAGEISNERVFALLPGCGRTGPNRWPHPTLTQTRVARKRARSAPLEPAAVSPANPRRSTPSSRLSKSFFDDGLAADQRTRRYPVPVSRGPTITGANTSLLSASRSTQRGGANCKSTGCLSSPCCGLET
jgi:hypothetical protein